MNYRDASEVKSYELLRAVILIGLTLDNTKKTMGLTARERFITAFEGGISASDVRSTLAEQEESGGLTADIAVKVLTLERGIASACAHSANFRAPLSEREQKDLANHVADVILDGGFLSNIDWATVRDVVLAALAVLETTTQLIEFVRRWLKGEPASEAIKAASLLARRGA